jgi:hypothetical protein
VARPPAARPSGRPTPLLPMKHEPRTREVITVGSPAAGSTARRR